MEVPTEGPDQGPLLPRNPRQAPDETRSSLEVASEELDHHRVNATTPEVDPPKGALHSDAKHRNAAISRYFLHTSHPLIHTHGTRSRAGLAPVSTTSREYSLLSTAPHQLSLVAISNSDTNVPTRETERNRKHAQTTAKGNDSKGTEKTSKPRTNHRCQLLPLAWFHACYV
ncbi:unnamed protein product [Penicillium bialowiezense]